MAPMRSSTSCRFSLLGLFLATMLLLLALSPSARATGLFKVRHKFLRRKSAIADLLAHDSRRHSRMLAVADLALGGIGVPTDTGLYYTEIGLGTPPKKFFVQVDTGSDILWVNCATCTHCPEKSDPGFDLTLYNPNTSVSRSFVSCQDNFCVSTHGDIPGCAADYPCRYKVIYGDGSSTAGFFVTDALQFPQVSNDHQTKLVNANVTFGPHYNVNLKAIEVGGAILPLPSILFDTGDGKGAIIDSGTTLSYVPEIVYKSLMRTVGYPLV